MPFPSLLFPFYFSNDNYTSSPCKSKIEKYKLFPSSPHNFYSNYNRYTISSLTEKVVNYWTADFYNIVYVYTLSNINIEKTRKICICIRVYKNPQCK